MPGEPEGFDKLDKARGKEHRAEIAVERRGLGADLGNDFPHRDSCSSSSDIDSASENDYAFSGTLLRKATKSRNCIKGAPEPPRA